MLAPYLTWLSFSWLCIFIWEDNHVTERCGGCCAMALTAGQIVEIKQAGRVRRNWMIMMFSLNLNHAHHWDPWACEFWGFRREESVRLACLAHMMRFDVVGKCEDLLKTFFFLPFSSRRCIVKSNTPLSQVLPWFSAEVPIYPKDPVHLKYTSTVACVGQKRF